MTEKMYTTYEQTADKEYTGKADTRTESEWFLYYLLWIDRAEYPDFITWFFDMLKSGNLTGKRSVS